MHALHVLATVLSQAGDAVAAQPWWQTLLNGTSLLTFLGLVWFIATYKGKVDRVIKVVTPEDEERALGARVKKLEDVVNGDGHGSPSCAQKHSVLEERMSGVPSRSSLNAAFAKIEELTKLLTDTVNELKLQAADDRRSVEVAIEHLHGVTKRLDAQMSRLLGEEPMEDERPAPMKRSATNPRLEVPPGVFKK